MKGSLTLRTNHGDIGILMHANFVPLTCENFFELSEKGYYNGTKFHRLVPNFMVCLLNPLMRGTLHYD